MKFKEKKAITFALFLRAKYSQSIYHPYHILSNSFTWQKIQYQRLLISDMFRHGSSVWTNNANPYEIFSFLFPFSHCVTLWLFYQVISSQDIKMNHWLSKDCWMGTICSSFDAFNKRKDLLNQVQESYHLCFSWGSSNPRCLGRQDWSENCSQCVHQWQPCWRMWRHSQAACWQQVDGCCPGWLSQLWLWHHCHWRRIRRPGRQQGGRQAG